MAKKNSEIIYDLKITLDHVKPQVWRQILVPKFLFLDDLHALIQLAMGWGSRHLYEFNINDARFTEITEEYCEGAIDAQETTIEDAIGSANEFSYTYDFGDYWVHKIEVMGLIEMDKNTLYPICIGGENACPPEDCGGAPGYEEFLLALSDPNDEMHTDMKSWIGGYFDPKSFDANLVNRILRSGDPEEELKEFMTEMSLGDL